MILNTGSRTDIPAFYSTWFMNRIREGYVLTRNPYYPKRIHRYLIDRDHVDMIVFCTKNPEPMLEYLPELSRFPMFWFVTITPYGKDSEPYVPDKHRVLESFRRLSQHVGTQACAFRYDPVFLSERYSREYHLRAFESICRELSGYTEFCIVSFIDLYEKTKKNFPEVREVDMQTQKEMCRSFSEIAGRYGISVRMCLEDPSLSAYGVNTDGCMTREVLERALGESLHVPSSLQTRQGCRCLLGNDIGEYNTCLHGCRYCYANYDMKLVRQNAARHDPKSPLLIGWPEQDDEISDAKQVLYSSGQMKLDL